MCPSHAWSMKGQIDHERRVTTGFERRVTAARWDDLGMWDWVEALLQYGLSPLVAAGAVLWTQRRADERDGVRRRDEQAFELAKRAEDRVSGIQERWRDDRRKAHAKVMTTVDGLIELFDEIRMSLAFDTFESSEASAARERFDMMVDRELLAATSEVLLIGSASAQHCAEQLVRAAREAALGVIVVPGDLADNLNHEHERALAVHGTNLLAARAEYLAAARADLETD